MPALLAALLCSCRNPRQESANAVAACRWTLQDQEITGKIRAAAAEHQQKKCHGRLLALERELEETEELLTFLKLKAEREGLAILRRCGNDDYSLDDELKRLDEAISGETDAGKLSRLKSDRQELLALMERLLEKEKQAGMLAGQLKKAEFRRMELMDQRQRLMRK